MMSRRLSANTHERRSIPVVTSASPHKSPVYFHGIRDMTAAIIEKTTIYPPSFAMFVSADIIAVSKIFPAGAFAIGLTSEPPDNLRKKQSLIIVVDNNNIM